jgi:hypothetical protein
MGVPANAPNFNLSRVLALRAAHGDTEAQRMLGAGVAMSFSLGLLNPKKAIKRDMRLFNPTDIKGKNPLGCDGTAAPGATACCRRADDPSQTDPMYPRTAIRVTAEFGSLTKPFDVEEFYNYGDPGYAFQLQQGNQALQNSAAAGSGALSGAALKDLIGYNQQFAGSAYNDAFNRYQTQQGNIYSRLMGVSQLGQNSASGVGTQGVALAGNAGQAISNAGAAYGAGIVGAGNSLSQGG